MAKSDLIKRLDDVEAALGRPVIMGEWAHSDGVPTYHHLASKGLNLQTWFETGQLPDRVQFFCVMHVDESERLHVPEGRDQFVPTEAELHAGWEPFPDLHPDTLRQFQKMLELPFYSFFANQLHGMNGALSRQDRSLYPHG